jgi:acetoin utilization protein AcuB
MNASELMTEHPQTIRAGATVAEAIEILQAMDIRHLPVLDEDDNLVGMLSDRDIGPLMKTYFEALDTDAMIVPFAQRRVAELMSPNVICVDGDTDVREVVEAMLEQRIGAVPVVDGEGTVTGIISYVDVLRNLAS